eukprot:m.489326 g.489326  ORF g.489326 m.489326 type:complete len:122 (+) comp21765_c0_seq1:136-501(+)
MATAWASSAANSFGVHANVRCASMKSPAHRFLTPTPFPTVLELWTPVHKVWVPSKAHTIFFVSVVRYHFSLSPDCGIDGIRGFGYSSALLLMCIHATSGALHVALQRILRGWGRMIALTHC